MAEAYKKLAQGQLGTSAADIYAPSGVTGIVVEASFLNVAATTVVIDLWVGGSADSNQIKKSVSLDPGECLEYQGKMPFATGTTFKGKCDTASAVTYTLYGAEL